MKLLVVEDDVQTANFLIRSLREDGHAVDEARSGSSALELARLATYDLLIVDRMLPGLDGLALVKQLRAEKCHARILFLTALGGLDDRVEGFEAGGDDYLQKPFAFSELRARIAALARRQLEPAAATQQCIGDLDIDFLQRSVRRAGKIIDLMAKEYQLLEYFVRHRGRIITRTMLLEQVWDLDFDPGSNVVESHISRLRSKIDKPFSTPLLKTIRGAGYRFDAP